MSKERAKKASSQIDWILSLSIFLVYLFWFFIFVVPSFEKPDTPGSVIANAFESLKNNLTWTVYKAPVIVRSNLSMTNEPIIMNYTWNWSNYILDSNNLTFRDRNRLLFVANLTKGPNIFEFVFSSKNYSVRNRTGFLHATDDYVSVNSKSFKVNIDGSILRKMTYFNSELIRDAAYVSKGFEIRPNSTSYLASSKVARYVLNSQLFNITTYLFAYNSRVYHFIEPNTNQDFNLTASYTLKKFTDYFSDNLNKGLINYSSDKCRTFNSDYIDVYGSLDGVSFYSTKPMRIRLCNINETLTLNLTIKGSSTTEFRVYAHDDNYNTTINITDPYVLEYGALEALTGISIDRTKALNKSGFDTIKSAFGIGSRFSFTVYNKTFHELLKIEKVSPSENDNVYVKLLPCWMLDKYGRIERCNINIKVW